MEKYFNFVFSITEAVLFVFLGLKILFNAIIQRKKITIAGVCKLLACLFLSTSCFISFIPNVFSSILPNDVFYTLKVFSFIMSLIYLNIYFYKMSEIKECKNKKKNLKMLEIVKKELYFFTAILFTIEVISVPIFSNSKNYINFYEIIIIIALLIFLTYQFYLKSKIKNQLIIFPWMYYTIFSIASLTIKSIIENLSINNIILILIMSFFNILQIFILGNITFFKKDYLGVCLK